VGRAFAKSSDDVARLLAKPNKIPGQTVIAESVKTVLDNPEVIAFVRANAPRFADAVKTMTTEEQKGFRVNVKSAIKNPEKAVASLELLKQKAPDLHAEYMAVIYKALGIKAEPKKEVKKSNGAPGAGALAFAA